MLSISVFFVKYIMEFLEKLAKWIYNTHLSSEAKYGLKIPTWNQYANDHGIGWGGGGGVAAEGMAPPLFLQHSFYFSLQFSH